MFFDGRCEEAIEFYRTALGAEVEMLMRYKDSPEPPPPGTVPAGYEDKVMHATFRIGGTALMACDGCGDTPSFAGFSLSLAALRHGHRPLRPRLDDQCRSLEPV